MTLYKIVAKVDTRELELETGLEEENYALGLCEQYATGREAAYMDHPSPTEQVSRIYYPLHRLSAVYVIAYEPKEIKET